MNSGNGMNCMKCGREIALGQVFCKECLADMEQYPIKPGTPVPQFDPAPAVAVKRVAAPRKQKKPEELVIDLKKWIIGLSISLLVVILSFSIVTAILVGQLENAENKVPAGQNYSSLDTTG
jgi:hypothetical protein